MKKKRILVTAGATIVPIDKVRAITNIFKGRTGTDIARHLAQEGHKVTLITSNLKLLTNEDEHLMNIVYYKTYNDLYDEMHEKICHEEYDVIIHSAAVSDYKVDGVFYKDKNDKLIKIDNSKKISSEYKELFLRLILTEKIVDRIRGPWKFKGYLVKFKLQVGISDAKLKSIAEKSRLASQADMVVANCLEWADLRAEIITAKTTTPVSRKDLAEAIRKEIGL